MSVKSRIAAADGQGHEHVAGSLLKHLQHGHVRQGEIPETGNVEKGDFIGPLFVVALGQGHRFAQIADVAFFAHIILVPLGDHQVTPVVGAHVQTGDDPFGQPRCRR